MAVKAKTKVSNKATKKPTAFLAVKSSPLSNYIRNFDSSLILKHKKITAGVVIIVIVLALLTVLFKSVFIAAIVNGEPITRLAVVSALEKQGGKTALNNLIIKKLILQEAKRRNIAVTQGDTDAEIKKITANLQTQGSTLDQALTSQGMTRTDLNDELQIQISLDKMVGTDATVTEKEVSDYVTANQSQITPGMTDAQFQAQAVAQLKQQKLQTKTQALIKSLQSKAKIVNFVSY